MKPEDFEIFATLVRQRSGMVLPIEKAYLLESRLDTVARKHSLKTLEDMANALRAKREDHLIADIAEAMTDGITWFFRDRAVFQAIGGTVLPRLIQLRADEKKLRLWSAATATGQEAYSLAMLCAEAAPAMPGWSVDIQATDMSHAAVVRAKSGIYSQFEVQRGLPIRMLVKYFGQLSGNKWQIDDRMRQMVRFQEANLFATFKDDGAFDLILCRYVLDGFDESSQGYILDAFAAVMRPGAMLVLSPGDTVGASRFFVAHDRIANVFVRNL